MKTQITMAFLAVFFTSCAVATQADQQETSKKVQTNTANIALSPQEIALAQKGSDEFQKAISEFGEAKYNGLYADLKKLEANFVNNPSQQTKEELLSFLKTNNLFAEIQKPIPQELKTKSTEPNAINSNYYPGVETDYAKIEAYYDKIINGTNDFFVTNISFTPDK